MPEQMPVPEGDASYILDGGALLHRVPWQRGMSYEAIYQQYVRYVVSHYGVSTIIFDGYADGVSTKDATHNRRTICRCNSELPSIDALQGKEGGLPYKQGKQTDVYRTAEETS